jgi:hypothetical protein
VAEHARKKQSAAEHADLERKLVREPGIGERPSHDADARREHREEYLLAIPATPV